MHVKRTVRRRGDKEYTYLSLVEAIRVNGKSTQRVLLRLGEVSELERTGQLDRIVAALRSYTEREWIAADEVEGAGAPSFGALAAVSSYFDRLGLRAHFAEIGATRGSKHLEDTVVVMVANRLCDPWSKRRTIFEWLDTVALPDGVSAPLLDQCYRALDAVAEAKEQTEEPLYRGSPTSPTWTCALSSTTSPPPTSRPARPHREVLLARLRLQPRQAARSPPGRDRSSRHRQRHPDRPPRLPRQHRGLDDAASGHGRLPRALRRRAHRPRRRSWPHHRAQPRRGADAGFDHVLATRLHRDADVAAVLAAAASADEDRWVPCQADSTACEVSLDGRRFVVVFSAHAWPGTTVGARSC